MNFPYSFHLKSINRNSRMWLFLYSESDCFGEEESILSFRMVYQFLKRRHTETIKIINNIVFYITCYPMTSAHV